MTNTALTFHPTNMSDRVRCGHDGEFVVYRDGDRTHVDGHARVAHGVAPDEIEISDSAYQGPQSRLMSGSQIDAWKRARRGQPGVTTYRR